MAARRLDIATSEIERHEHATCRAWIAPCIWTPCFPCLFSWAFHPGYEEAVRQRAEATEVLLDEHGLSIRSATDGPCISACCCLQRTPPPTAKLVIPYDTIVALQVDTARAGSSSMPLFASCCCACCGRCCHCCPPPPRSVTIVVAGTPEPVRVLGVADPDAFVRDVLAARKGDVTAVETAAAAATILKKEHAAGWFSSFWRSGGNPPPSTPGGANDSLFSTSTFVARDGVSGPLL